MLVIRNGQMEIFEEIAHGNFVEKMTRWMIGKFPDLATTHNADELHHAVRMGIQRADAFGIRDDEDIMCFLDLMGKHGLRFSDQAWAQDILAQIDLQPCTRLDLLTHTATNQEKH